MLGPMQTRPSQQDALQLPPTLEDKHDNDSDGVDSDEQIVVDTDGVDFNGVYFDKQIVVELMIEVRVKYFELCWCFY